MTSRLGLRARLPQPSDDRGSLAFAILAIVIAAALGGIMMPIIVNQVQTTRTDTTRVRSLQAAQTGIDVTLGQFRAATTPANGVTAGDPSVLPCGPLTGNPNGTGTATYSASIAYYAVNPATSSARPMACTPNYGPFDQNLNTRTPRYAIITSIGKDAPVNDASKGRTLQTTYVFQTNDFTTGQLKIANTAGAANYCLDASSATPSAGTSLLIRTCSTTNPPPAQQDFVYRQDGSIQLVSSVIAGNPAGTCIDTNATVRSYGTPVVLNVCTNADPSQPAATQPSQQWSFDDSSRLRVAPTNTSELNGFCLYVVAQKDGQPLTLGDCVGPVNDPARSWTSGPSIGVSVVGPINNQIVNYRYSATCIDVANEDPNSAFLILYPCKQDPTPGNITWNQKFSPTLGPLSRAALPQTAPLQTNNGTAYCLRSPTALGGYAVLTTSCASATNWTWNQTKDGTLKNKDGSPKDLPYSQMYTIVDSSGRCLSPGPATDQFSGAFYKLIVTTCDGDTDQKWNADPRALTSHVLTTIEK